ncbi:MAG TPA: ABC transporter permease [Thermoanaerobaculia bacterium]|nr:ABC transporter permease [Thermoanaerobaculia bacterium]
MTKTWEVFRFELGFQMSRVSTRIYFALFLSLALLMSFAIYMDARHDGYFFNAPIVTSLITIITSMVSLLVTSGVAGDAATRDGQVRIDSLLYTTPLRKASYLAGRFLGAFAVTALLLLAVPLGLLLATRVPGIDPAALGPLHVEAYLTSYFLFALPNAFLATAVLFSLATISRSAVTAYAGAAVLFFSAFITEGFIGAKLGKWGLAKLLDPLGYTPLHALWMSFNTLQKNTLLIPLDQTLLSNRLLWIGVAIAVLAIAHLRFRFAYATGGRTWRRTAVSEETPAIRWTGLTIPAARRVFGPATRLRQMRAVAMRSFRELVMSKAWLLVPLTAILFVSTAAEVLEVELGTPGAATTARVAEVLAAGELARMIAILIAISAGELVWRERDARMNAIADVTPVPEWLSFLGKFLALGLMLALTEAIFLASGVGVQWMMGFAPLVDLGLYVKTLFGFQLIGFLLFAALAMVIHVLVNQKYVANVLAILAYVALQMARELGVEHNLLLYGGAPEWTYSQMNGFGPQLTAWGWFTFYWSGWALLFGVVTYLFWMRGEERGLRTRLAFARRRLTRGPAAAGALALAIIAGAGGFVFYNTNVLNRYSTDAEQEEWRAEYERRYGRYASLPQPLLAATKLRVDFQPQRGSAEIRGSYRLENRSNTAIDTIHLVTSPSVETSGVTFDRPSRVTLHDQDFAYRIYSLGKPIQPGESVHVNFAVRHAPRGFTNRGRSDAVVGNGSWIQHRAEQAHGARQWLPFVGYQTSRELSNPGARRKLGLRERKDIPPLEDVAARSDPRGREKIALETIIGTDAEQTGVAPGELRRTWSENGRRYFHYITDAPITNSYAIYSARYAVQRAKWRDVDIEILHHPAHTRNLGRMLQSVRASLDYHTRHYSPYPHRQLRLVEYPSTGRGLGLTSFPGLIEYSEAFALVRPEDDARKIDFPFAVMGHEMGHQWWGHQLMPALVEGAPVLSESLAWYSAMMVIEETHGREHLMRLVDIMRSEFLAPHMTAEVPLMRTFDRFDAYRVGPFAMYAMRESVGEEQVNAALRTMLAKYDPARTPFPTTLDLYRELRAVTPPAKHALLKDLFEEITFWNLRTKKAHARPAGNGTYRLTLEIDAEKLKGNALGRERPVPMHDTIVVAAFDAAGKTIYRQEHPIRSGAQTITITVPGAPARAGLDPDHALLDRRPEDNDVATGFSPSPAG